MYLQVEQQTNDYAAEPIEQQQEAVIRWTTFEVVIFQSQRIVIQEVAVQHEVESGRRIDRIEEEASYQSPYL